MPDEFDDNTLLFTIGSILVDWMILLNLVKIKTVNIAFKKSNILVPSSIIVSVMNKEKKHIIYHLPKANDLQT